MSGTITHLLLVKFHINGQLIEEITTPAAAIDAIDWVATFPMTARIGAYQTEPIQTDDGDFGVGTYGSLQGSIDEFRFWKKARSSKEIGRFWFTQFGGGTNTDEANTTLGVYYKFNEGIVDTTAIANVDANVLDYSGRITNGSIFNYDLGVRSVESAIDEYGANNTEFRDPIMYSFHPDVQEYRNNKQEQGYVYDLTNVSSIFKSIPGWIVEEAENKNSDELSILIQIVSSYFDTLHLQIEALPTIGAAEYVQSGEKPLPFAKRLLDSKGFVAPEIFVDTNVLESLVNRAEDRTYEEDVENVKNEIYQNIYNNISNIYKSKGTEKAFRNLLRCFGIGDELIKINLYGDGVKFKFEDYYRSVSVKKSYIDLNNPDRFDGYVKQLADPAIPDSKSYIEGATSPDLTYIPITMESEVVFPKKLPLDHPDFFKTPFTTVSLFGLHNVGNAPVDIDTWTDSGFAVYAEKREEESTEVKFVLKPYGFSGALPMETGWFKDVYENEKWNIAVRVRPTVNKLDLVQNASTGILDPDYVLEFYGVNMVLDIVQEEFSLTQSLDLIATETFLNTEKRSYVGAEYTNFTTLNERSDAKISSTRVWLDYLDDDTIKSHAKDVENYGTKDPYKEAYFSQTSVADVRVPQTDTLLLHWDFQTVGASDGSGEFIVSDTAYGPADARYGAVLGNILGYQYTGLGTDFFADDKKVTDKTYVFSAKQQLPENISSNSTINILTQDDDVFTRESEPFNYFWAIEKSMYQTISDEMIDIFASISAFNNLIGNPVNRYRTEYKDLTKLRQLFFERIENEPDIEKYIEFYKWIDAAVNQMLQQLIPASANFSQDMRTMIESHVLERSKYRNKYQYFGPRKDEDPTPLLGINEMLYNWKEGRARVEEDESCLWWKVRARRDESPLATGDSEVDVDRQQILDVTTRVNSGSWESRSLAEGSDTKNMTEYQGQTFALRSLSQPYRFKVDDQHVVKSGTNVYRNKKKDYVKVETQPFSSTTVVTQEAPGYANSSCVDDEDRNALKKEKVAFSADGAKGLLLSPIDLYEDVVNDQNYWTNLHDDSYGEDKETPMQGPFTYAHVGGSPHRHVPINETDRPEAWEFDGTTFSEPDDLRAKFYRDETAKRPLNIKNIKYDIDDAIYGNYRYDYEIVQTSGRRLNNVWFVKQQGVLPGANASTQSDAVYGHYDFELPNRGRNEHVFVERFSAPGSSDTLGRGMLDVEAEEYSPYNSLNFRNLNVRTKLNQWLTFHSKFGGDSASCDNPTDQYPCVPSFHKTQRNEKNKLGNLSLPAGEFCSEKKYDNFWKVEMYPVSEYGYSWISDSVLPLDLFAGANGSFCQQGYVTGDDRYRNVSAYKPPLKTDPYLLDYGSYYSINEVVVSAGELEFEEGLPFISNFQSYEGVNHPRTYDSLSFINIDPESAIPEVIDGTFFVGASYELPEVEKLIGSGELNINQILNNRGDKFGYQTWRQVRNADNKVPRFMKSVNVISIEDNPKVVTINVSPDPTKLSPVPVKPKRERTAKMYVEPKISWNRPLQHRLQFRGGSTAAKVFHPYSNNLEMFANPFINKRLGIENKNIQLYDVILEQYITDENRYAPKFFELKYDEYIYPKHRNATLRRTRLRSQYTETRNKELNGLDRRSSLIRTFWKDDVRKRQRTVYQGLNSTFTAENAFGYQARNSSVWALDYFKYTDPTGETDNDYVMRGDLAWAGFAQFRGYVYEPFSDSEILSWRDDEGNGEVENGNIDHWIAPRPTLQFIHNPNSQKAREEGWAWNTQLISGNKPWFNSYENFAADVKLIGQNYSIVPEYRISQHMDFYVNERGGNFRAQNKRIFEIVGNDRELNNSGEREITTEDYFSYDGVTEVETYEYEPNYAKGYESIALGEIFGANLENINSICFQEPPADIDFPTRGWRCQEFHPVSRLNLFNSVSSIPQYLATEFLEFSTLTVKFDADPDNLLFPAYTDTTNEISSEQAWSDDTQPRVPVGYSPIPYDWNQEPALPQGNPTPGLDSPDTLIYKDMWENSFLLSFWIKLDREKLVAEYYDEQNLLSQSVGCLSFKTNDIVTPEYILSKTPEQVKSLYGLTDDNELSNFLNSKFELEKVGVASATLNPYQYYLFYREVEEGTASSGTISNVDAYELVAKDFNQLASFYLLDHTDQGITKNGEVIKNRPYWADSLGNKIYFDIQFGGPTKYAFDSWHHISILYFGGSQAADVDQAGYDSRFHRVFLWVDNEKIPSQIWNAAASDWAGGDVDLVDSQKFNGTLFMDNDYVGGQRIESFGVAENSFVFGKCSGYLDEDDSLGYELPTAKMPASATDLVFIRGGDIDISPRSNIGECEDVPETGDDYLESLLLLNKFKWFFDNSLPSFLTNKMNSSLIDALYTGQCQDQNVIFSTWADENCEKTVTFGAPQNQFEVVAGDGDIETETETFVEQEGDVKNCPLLLGWWKMGIPRFDKQTLEQEVWRGNFFKNFAHTDDITHLNKLSLDHKSLGPGASKVLRLEVDAVKKLLPYNGFYPSQRTVQLGSLFYDSVSPHVVGRNEDQQWERARTEQALLQPFFSPGILFNTIKSGIAVDWAAYSGEYSEDGSIITLRDEFFGEVTIIPQSSESAGAGSSGSEGGNPSLEEGQQNKNGSPFGGTDNIFTNTNAIESITKRAQDSLRRDLLLGKTDARNINSVYNEYYKKALEDTKEVYERLAKKLQRGEAARNYEIWAEERELDPFSELAQEQYRSTKVRDVDWKYDPQYASQFPIGLQSLIDKSYNTGTRNELTQVKNIILNTLQTITQFPSVRIYTERYQKMPSQKVGGPLKLTDATNDQATAGNSNPGYGGLNSSDCIPDDPTPGGETCQEQKLENKIIDWWPYDQNLPCCDGFNQSDNPGNITPGSSGQGSLPPGKKPQPGGDNPGGSPTDQQPVPDPGPTEDSCEEPLVIEEDIIEDIERQLEGVYLDRNPNFRIPFEGLVSIDSVLPLQNSTEPSKIFFLAPSYYTSVSSSSSTNDNSQNRHPYFEWTGEKNALYELAMNNFLAEIPNFFLKAGQFTTFASKPESEFKTVEEGKTYFMDVHLYKTEDFAMTISPYDGETVFVNKTGDGLEEPAQAFLDGDGNPYTTQGRYYGPAVRYKTFSSNNLENFYIGDPAQAPYVPPYFYGRAKARISFTPEFSGRPTLDQILNNINIEYINEEMDYLFASKFEDSVSAQDLVNNLPVGSVPSWKEVPAYIGRMPIESSINFFGKTKRKKVLYDVVDTGFQFNPTSEVKNTFIAKTAEDSEDGVSTWTISSRFECPTLNFDTIENKATRVYEVPVGTASNVSEDLQVKGFVPNLNKGEPEDNSITQYGRDVYGRVSRNPRGVGMWSGFGFIPDKEQGIFMTLEESYKRRRDIATPLKCVFESAEVESDQKVLVAIPNLTELDTVNRNTIRLTDIYGNSDEISIGQPSGSPDQIVPKKNVSTNAEAALLGLSSKLVDLYEKKFDSTQGGGESLVKVRTVLTAEGSTINDPNKGMDGAFDVEAFLQFGTTSPIKLQVADPSDIGNAICYHTNYRYSTEQNFAWKASIRWIREASTPPAGIASEFAETYSFEEQDLQGYSAVVEFEWAPKQSAPIYQGQTPTTTKCQIDLLPGKNTLIGAIGSSQLPLGLRYIGENLKVDSILEVGAQENRNFYSDIDSFDLVNCEEVGSLIDICGFQSSRSRVGDIADEKEISEAVVMIPFVDEKISSKTKANTVEVMGRNFFKISKSLFNFTKANVDAGKPAISRDSTYNVEEDIEDTSVSDMIKNMQRYNIPPMLDFITYPLKAGEFPFVMYIFEFTETLDKDDLSNIWQGLMPQISRTATKQSQVIEHEMNKINFFEGKELPENVRWLVFRVKRKANINYFQVTADSQDDDRFKFNFDVGIKAPEYSYNWPYDFCSLVEMARIKGGVSILPAVEDTPSSVRLIKKDKLGDIEDASVNAGNDKLIKKSSNSIVDWDDVRGEDE
jgi:hypothetical protein